MIKNERQYRITKAQAARFAETLERLGQGSGGTAGVHPRIVQAQADAIRSQLADLEREVARVRDIEGRRIQARKAECGGRVGDGIDQGADRAGTESKGIGGADRSQGAADPAPTRRPTTQLRALLESERWRVRWGRRTNTLLAGRQGRLLGKRGEPGVASEEGEPAELECFARYDGEDAGARGPKTSRGCRSSERLLS